MKVYVAIILALTLVLVAVGCTPAATTAPTQAQVATAAPTTAPTVAPTAAPTEAPSAQPADTSAKDYNQIGMDLMASESMGDVHMGMTETQLKALLGEPTSKTVPDVWGSDGLEHSSWSYEDKGLDIGFSRNTEKDKEATVCYISAYDPCALATKKGIKLGDTADAVKAAYTDAIDPQAVDEDNIVAGTVFGGIQFAIKDGKVTGIDIGASAE